MNASAQSPPQKHHHPHLERGALTLLALASLFSIWLGIGLPGLPPLAGGSAEADGRDTLVAHLVTGRSRAHQGQIQRAKARPRSPSFPAQHAARSPQQSAVRLATAPPAPPAKQAAATQTRQPDTTRTPTSPAPAPQVVAKAPAAPEAPAAPSPSPPAPTTTPDPVQTTVDDVQKTVGAATAAVPSASDVQQTVQNVQATVQNTVTTVKNAVPQLPQLP